MSEAVVVGGGSERDTDMGMMTDGPAEGSVDEPNGAGLFVAILVGISDPELWLSELWREFENSILGA
jgi:hypothetical protein